MTYEEMMILTEQHLESKVFKPPFAYTGAGFWLFHPPYQLQTLLSSNLRIHQLSMRHEIKQRTLQLYWASHTYKWCDFASAPGFNETDGD